MERSFAAFALPLLLGAAACSESSTDGDPGSNLGDAAAVPEVREEVTNAMNFHLLDFVAWNDRNVEMFRRLHTADVKVEIGGAKMDGIDAHAAILPAEGAAGALLVSHAPLVAEGEWTCAVGTSAPPMSSKVVTVAKWRNGAIAEEYIALTLLGPGVAKPAVSGEPMVSISNRNAEMAALVGAELGWSCRLERTGDGKLVITLSKSGAEPQEMVFTQ